MKPHTYQLFDKDENLFAVVVADNNWWSDDGWMIFGSEDGDVEVLRIELDRLGPIVGSTDS